jgi:ankyrin repeat protein
MVYEQFKKLIDAIKSGNYGEVEKVLEENKVSSCEKSSIINLKDEDFETPLHIAFSIPNPDCKIISLLCKNGADPDIKNTDEKTVLHEVIQNKKLWEALPEEVRELLLERSDINYRYIGPVVQMDNYLHITARTANIDGFMCIFKKSMEKTIPLLEYNADDDNPLHLGAYSGVLLPLVREMFTYLDSTANDKIKVLENLIKGAKENKSNAEVYQKELIIVKKRLKNDKEYVRGALNGNGIDTPLTGLYSTFVEGVRNNCHIL